MRWYHPVHKILDWICPGDDQRPSASWFRFPKPASGRRALRVIAQISGPRERTPLRFFTDDYKLVYMNGQFVPEASNRAKETLVVSHYCPAQKTCTADIYYVDTGRPKEDLGLWRWMKKGIQSAGWLDGNTEIPLHVGVAGPVCRIRSTSAIRRRKKRLVCSRIFFSAPRSQRSGGSMAGLHARTAGAGLSEWGLRGTSRTRQEPNIGRPGIYLPPSILKEDNKLLFVALEPTSAESSSSGYSGGVR